MTKNKKFKYKRYVIADAGFVINLPSRTDRKEMVTKLLDELKFTGWEFVDGIVESDPFWHKYGCTQTFLKIFQTAIDNNYKSIVIFEDDIKLGRLTKKEDLDMVFKHWKKEHKKYDLIGMGTRPLEGSRIFRDSEHFGSVTNCVCAHAWYYTIDFMKYAVEEMKGLKNPEDKNYRAIIDEFINDCCSLESRWRNNNKLFKVGVTIPLLFIQGPGYSNNENQYHDYGYFIEDLYYLALDTGDKETNRK